MRRLHPLHRPLRHLILVALAATILTGCGAGASKQHLTARHSLLESIFEAPVQLMSSPGPTLDLLRRLGVENVRVVLRWSSLAPAAAAHTPPAGLDAANPAAYPASAWAPYDAIISAARARGIGVLLDISGPAPLWATGPGAPPGGVPGVWKPSAAQFGLFVRAAGTRYSGHYTPPGGSRLPRVSFWSVWNEPNLGQANLAPQAIQGSKIETSPEMYRALLDGAWASLQASGHGRDTILFGEIAPYGQFIGNNVPGDFGYMVPLRFVRALYCVDASLHPLQGPVAAARGCPSTPSASRSFAAQHPALFQASGFALHPYASGETAAPNVVLPIGKDFVYLSTISRLEHLLDTVTQLYGSSRHFSFYSTEYGYRTDPPSPAAPSLTVAAEDLNWAEYLSWRNPRLRSFDQYLLVDPATGGPSQFTTGLEFATGQPKPSYFAWRLPIFLPATQQRGSHGLEVWGDVRPAHYTLRPQNVRIELRRASTGAFQTVATVPVTDASGYFDTTVRFPAGGQVRLAWTYPRGSTIYSRLVTISAR